MATNRLLLSTLTITIQYFITVNNHSLLTWPFCCHDIQQQLSTKLCTYTSHSVCLVLIYSRFPPVLVIRFTFVKLQWMQLLVWRFLLRRILSWPVSAAVAVRMFHKVFPHIHSPSPFRALSFVVLTLSSSVTVTNM